VQAPPRSLALIALALAVAVLLVHARVAIGGQTWADVPYHVRVAPPRLAAAAAIARGELPAWWDGSGLGVPMLAEPSHGAAYPPLWPAHEPRTLDLLLLLHLFFAALGVAAWARDRGATEVGALLAAVLVASSGLATSLILRGALPALAYLPWIGLAATRLASGGRARDAAVLAAAIGATWLTGELGAVLDATLVVVAVVGGGGAPRRGAWVALGLVVGAALGAAQWLPAILHLGSGVAGAPLAPLPGAQLLGLVVPVVPTIGDAVSAPWAPTLFVGAPLLALALGAPPATRRLIAVVGLGALAAVVGRGAAWPAWLGAPALHLGAAMLVLAVDAARGADALLDGAARPWRALAAAVGLTALGLGATVTFAVTRGAGASVAGLLGGGLGLAAMIAALVASRHGGGARRRPLILALLVAPSLIALPLAIPLTARAVVAEAPAWVAPTAGSPPPRRRFRPSELDDVTPPLDEALATLAGTAAARFGIAEARSGDPARPAIHDALWLAAAAGGGRLLERYAIALAVLPPTMIAPGGFIALATRDRWALAALPVGPPAVVATGWRWVADDADAVRALFPPGAAGSAPHAVVVLRGGGVDDVTGGAPTPCAVERWQPGEIDLTCAAPRASYAVVSSTPAPGWSATVDGLATPWLTADALRRALPIPAGEHHLRWRYRPPAWSAALALSASGLLGLLGLLVVAGRHRRAEAG
jgi:hypothetical protein